MSNQEVSGGEFRCLDTYKRDFIISIKAYYTVTAGIFARCNYGTEVCEIKGLDIQNIAASRSGRKVIYSVIAVTISKYK